MDLWLTLAIPAAVTVAGGLGASFWCPRAVTRSLFQHFAAGVVTAALAVEVLPDIEATRPAASTALGAFAIGGGAVFGMKWLFSVLERRRGGKRGSGALAAATALDVAIDGLVIGMGFAMSRTAGLTLAIGLSAEMLFLGLAVATELETRRRWLPLAATAGLAALLVAGGLVGAYGIGGASERVRVAGLAFGAAAILYLVTEELLVEAHEQRPRGPAGAGLLLLGFLSFWAIRFATG